jgi:hypothetical protein
MHHSLLGVLGKLDPTTRVYCGHEVRLSLIVAVVTCKPGESCAGNSRLSQLLLTKCMHQLLPEVHISGR